MKKRILTIMTALLLVVLLASVIGCSKTTGKVFPDWVYENSVLKEDNSFAQGADTRIMSYNVLVDAWGGKELASVNMSNPILARVEMFSKVMEHYSPDVVGMQETCEKWHKYLPEKISDNYTMMLTKGLEYTTMIYNHKKVKLVEQKKIMYSEKNSSLMRYVVWGLFEKLDSKKQFIVMNTHLDFGENKDKQWVQIAELNNIYQELSKKYDMPIYAVGDFNMLEKVTDDAQNANDVYQKFLTDSQMIDTNYMNIQKKEGSNQKWDEAKWDHIFVNAKCDVKSFSILSNDFYSTLSDHYPIYVDCKL